MPTEMELTLEQTQQGVSYEVSILNDDGNHAWSQHVHHASRCSDNVEHAVLMNLDTYVLERFDTSAGNPVKEILLKLNLLDHRSILTDSKVTPTNHMRITKPYSSPRFIANCFNAGYLKMEVKVPDSAGLNKIQ
ncbi:hypothetical protein Tco_1319806 [Tanacetum coccineum]